MTAVSELLGCRASGVRHVRIQDLVLRGATGSPMIHLYGSQHIDLDHVTVFGGFPALLINASQNIRVTNSAFRIGALPLGAVPWRIGIDGRISLFGMPAE